MIDVKRVRWMLASTIRHRMLWAHGLKGQRHGYGIAPATLRPQQGARRLKATREYAERYGKLDGPPIKRWHV